MTDIYTLDLALFAAVVVSAIVAYLRGFVREVFSLASWIGAAVIAWFAFNPLVDLLSQYIQPELLARIAAGAGSFLAALALLSVIAGRLAGLVERSSHGALDRSLGFLFGLVRGAVIICAFYLVGTRLVPPEHQPGWVQNARSIPLVASGAGEIEKLLPPRLADYGAAEKDRIQRELERIEAGNRLYEKLERPEAEAETAATDPPKGYNDRDRRDLDRLIDGN
ncbi:MAG: CvpA family protein [Alphaproteobacteria bacterium]|nr:CvpA family protein [Alphaproteobacteria bacterium]